MPSARRPAGSSPGCVLDGAGLPRRPVHRAVHLPRLPAGHVLRLRAGGGDRLRRSMRPAGWGVGLLAQGVAARDRGPQPDHVADQARLSRAHPPAVRVGAAAAARSWTAARAHRAETTRQRYEDLHAATPPARACHRMMDPIGFAFEHLDATGRFRGQEGRLRHRRQRLHPRHQRRGPPFTGPTELARELSRLPETLRVHGLLPGGLAFGVPQPSASCLVRWPPPSSTAASASSTSSSGWRAPSISAPGPPSRDYSSGGNAGGRAATGAVFPIVPVPVPVPVPGPVPGFSDWGPRNGRLRAGLRPSGGGIEGEGNVGDSAEGLRR